MGRGGVLIFLAIIQAIFPTKETLQNNLAREPTDSELAEATNMNVLQLRKHMQVGKAARNKLIKVRNI